MQDHRLWGNQRGGGGLGTWVPWQLPASQTHHDLAVHEVLLLLETDHRTGLDDEEVVRRLELYGPNQLPRVPSAGPLRRFLRQMHNPLVYVLIVAGVVTLFLHEYVDASVIFGVVLVNTIVGFIQESKAESALDALRSMAHTDARVIRGDTQRRVHSELLVPGDLVLVEAGDKVPADLRLVSETELQVDESALTGESMPVAKDELVLPQATPVADRRNMAYSGTLVTGGTGSGIVVATGGGTELGEIHRLVGSATTLATPLTRKLATFSAWLTVVILGLAAATFAIGVSRMARRGAVIRRLSAVETLGARQSSARTRPGRPMSSRSRASLSTVAAPRTTSPMMPRDGACWSVPTATNPGSPTPAQVSGTLRRRRC